MIVTKTKIDGVYTIDLEPRIDDRGYFTRVFCQHELKKAKVSFPKIVQINRSLTKQKGMIRGLHRQLSPKSEDKIVQCLKGEIFDVVVDVRKGSTTYGQWFGEILSEKNNKMMIVPKDCAHGFQALTSNCLVEYFVSEYYSPAYEKGICWNDPKFGINWPIKKAIVSHKDGNWPLFI